MCLDSTAPVALMLEFLSHSITLLQSKHSGGVPLHNPPKDFEKHEPWRQKITFYVKDITLDDIRILTIVLPDLGGPEYLAVHPPVCSQSYLHVAAIDPGEKINVFGFFGNRLGRYLPQREI